MHWCSQTRNDELEARQKPQRRDRERYPAIATGTRIRTVWGLLSQMALRAADSSIFYLRSRAPSADKRPWWWFRSRILVLRAQIICHGTQEHTRAHKSE